MATKNTKAAPANTPAERLALWLMSARGALASIISTAAKVSAACEREGSPFAGLLAPADLERVAGMLSDADAALSDLVPDAAVPVYDPFAA